ncbi:hypothetical protein [Streptomyces sp. GESEQ-4]|uniref:hypothetical protein n=1 Tax=Streptomyces sp. GESEQ-4 TaxID=2812655 RepID=UPI001B341B72|nr:hypothetical protein [Streptomyces sp. GESEQ-4]
MAFSGIRNLAAAAKRSPSDAATYIVIAVIAALMLLDLSNVLSLSVETLAKATIFILIFFLGVIVATNRAAVKQRTALEEVVSVVGRLQQEIELRGVGAQAVEIPPYEINGRLQALLQSANSWHFRGGLGSWQRSTALPALAKVTSRDVPYVMQVLNPAHEDLCRRYADYRARSRHRPTTGDPGKVRDELLSLLYAAAWYGYRTRINPEVSFLPLFSPLRYDMSDAGLILTVPNPEERALYAPSNGWHYTAVRDELEQATGGLPRVMLPSEASMFPSDWTTVGAQHAQDALSAMRINTGGRSSQPLLRNWANAQNLDFSRIAQLAFAGRAN